MIDVVVPANAIGPASKLSVFLHDDLPPAPSVHTSSSAHASAQLGIFVHLLAQDASTVQASPTPQPDPQLGTTATSQPASFFVQRAAAFASGTNTAETSGIAL